MLAALNHTPKFRRVPLGIQAHTVQCTEVTGLTVLVVYNSIATAGYPSRITSISRCIRRLKNTSI